MQKSRKFKHFCEKRKREKNCHEILSLVKKSGKQAPPSHKKKILLLIMSPIQQQSTLFFKLLGTKKPFLQTHEHKNIVTS